MAWNRPTSNTGNATSSSRPSGRGKMPRLRRGLVAGAIVVLGAGLVAWLLTNGEAASSPLQKKDRGLIKEATPAASAKPKEPTNAEKLRAKYVWANIDIPDDWDKPYPPQAYRPDGTLKRYSKYVHVVTNTRSRASMSVEELTFNNHAERQMAVLLMVNPGETLIGDAEYGEGFRKRFLKSLEQPIVIDEKEDTPFQQELKRAMIEVKADLKARHDAGEDIVAIMNETRAQLRELGLYREEIKKMVSEARAKNGENFSEQDERDLINAANKMLEERGCKPLAAPRIFLEKVGMDGQTTVPKEQGESI